MSKRIWLLVLVIIFVSSFLLRILPSLNYNFPFTTDQGRDMLDIRNILVGKHPTLIGPTTSINGVFLGPFWYYFNAIPFFLSQGDPQSLVFWNIGWYMLSFFLIWYVNKKHSFEFALICSILLLTAPILFFPSRFSWSANPMPFFTIFYFLCLYTYLTKPTRAISSILALVIGLSLQIEAAFGILFLPFAILVSIWKKVSLKNLLILIGTFLLTLLSQLFFELRHNFLMTKTFINELSGNSQILGDKLTLLQTYLSHYLEYTNIPHGLFKFPEQLTTLLFFGVIIYMLIRIKTSPVSSIIKNYFLLSLFFILFSFIFYMFYPHNLKSWYLLGLNIPYILIFAAFITDIFSLKIKWLNILMILLLSFSIYHTYLEQLNYVPKEPNFRSSDKSTLRNELEAIDWIYQKADGKGFKVYNYIPSVYDFPYQYLFWWYGLKKYGYLPDVLTYKDNVPEYIPNNSFYLKNTKPTNTGSPIFLLYEKDESPIRLYAWLGDFTKLCPVEEIKYPWGTTVELRKPCKN